MHELAIAQSIVDTIVARTHERKVAEISLAVGRLAGVSADSLRFCFELAVADTALEGARLDITEPAGQAHCVTCGRNFTLTDPILLCDCGSSDVRVVAGDDLRITSVKVVREDEPIDV